MPEGKKAAKRPPLTLDQINAVDDMAPIEVDIPLWGGVVLVRPLTLQQINTCNRAAADPKRGGEIHVEKRNGLYLVEGMVEPAITLEDAERWLTERAAGPVTDILAEILTASGLTERAKETAKSGPTERSDSEVSVQPVA